MGLECLKFATCLKVSLGFFANFFQNIDTEYPWRDTEKYTHQQNEIQ